MVLVLLHFGGGGVRAISKLKKYQGLLMGPARALATYYFSPASGISTSARVGERGALPELQSAKERVALPDLSICSRVNASLLMTTSRSNMSIAMLQPEKLKMKRKHCWTIARVKQTLRLSTISNSL
jgi:hypothetical protein